MNTVTSSRYNASHVFLVFSHKAQCWALDLIKALCVESQENTKVSRVTRIKFKHAHAQLIWKQSVLAFGVFVSCCCRCSINHLCSTKSDFYPSKEGRAFHWCGHFMPQRPLVFETQIISGASLLITALFWPAVCWSNRITTRDWNTINFLKWC